MTHSADRARAVPALTPKPYRKSFAEFIGIGPNGNLWVEDCDVKQLADRFGTPLYIISESQFRHTYRQFRDALQKPAASTKWGMTRAQTVDIVKRALDLPHIHLRETHYHLSRMTNDPRYFAVMAREMITWSGYIREQAGWTPPCIDIGGGWTF